MISPRKIIGLLGLVMLCAVPAAGWAETIERELYRKAPDMIKTLKDRGYKNVGVLRFLVQKGDEKPTTLAGTLNLDMANRVAIALVLQNNGEPPLGILRDPNAVAAKLPGASHLTREGRDKLFAATYPLAWGKEQVSPDAFITGTVKLSKDLKKMSVQFVIIDKAKGIVENELGAIEGTVEPANLVEVGESFHLRGLFDKAEIAMADPAAAASEQALKVKAKMISFPLEPAAAPPIMLDILYDGEKIPLRIDGGTARVKEPMEGQKIAFVLTRNAGVKGRYKIVLKVNGVNSVSKERQPDRQCRGWVLENNVDTLKIEGFQLDDNVAEQFEASSREVSRDREVYYGDDVGTITLTVYGERQSKEAPPVSVDAGLEKENVTAVQYGAFPKGDIKSLDALRANLQKDVRVSRGLIEAGNKIPFDVRRVTFNHEPTPIMSVVITYYRPQTK